MCICWLGCLVACAVRPGFIGFASLAMGVFALIAIWQTNLEGGRMTAAVFISFMVGLFLALTCSQLKDMLKGDFDIYLTVLVVTGCVIGLPVLICYISMKKKGIGWNDPFIQDQHYAQEKWKNRQEKTYGMARRTSGVLFHLFPILKNQLFLSLALMLATAGGVHFIEGIDTVICKFTTADLLWIMVSEWVILLFLLLFTGLWGVWEYKHLEIECLHLGHELKGARQFNTAASRAHLGFPSRKTADVNVTDNNVAGKKAENLADCYLLEYGQLPVNPVPFQWLGRILTAAQFLLSSWILGCSFF